MTYVSKREKVFDLPEQEESSSVSLTKPESKLKRFASVSDRRAWTTEECQKYQHLYGLVNGSESNVSKSSSFKYIPFDVLLAILMAEKDAYIQELLDKQGDSRTSSTVKANVLYKSDGFEDSDDDREALIRKDAEVVALKNKIAGLESELEDYRDTITKAMHKLENMDAIINENNFLKEKIKCSEETIKCLEEKKAKLEKELDYYRNIHNSDGMSRKYQSVERKHHWDGGDCNQPVNFSFERNILIQQVQDLQKELEILKKDAAEVEVLRKVSQETSTSLEELSKENECYKQKLESVKFLEKNIEELKKQGHALTDKYKKESQKANDLLKQIQQNSKELENLKQERDNLQFRVSELMNYESQYMSLKSKLHQVEYIIDENEMLNQKLLQLDRLELENEKLKVRIEQMKCVENQALEDKEKVMQLQCVVVEQKEEIRKMLRHVQDLSENYPDKTELYRLRVEIEEKEIKLKNYEKQLSEIPILELEIDKLKNKLQKCIEDFKADKELLRRLQEELEACRKRCHELEEMTPVLASKSTEKLQMKEDELAVGECQELCQQRKEEKLECADKGENTVQVEKHEAESQSEKPEVKDKIVLTVNESVEEIEKQNEILKTEVARLTSQISRIDVEKVNAENNDLRCLLELKERQIDLLNEDMNEIRKELKGHESLKEILIEEVEILKQRTDSLRKELNLTKENLEEAEGFWKKEKKGREFAMSVIKTLEEKLEMEKERTMTAETLRKLQKEEANVTKQEIYMHFGKEINNLKNIISLSKKLNYELGVENTMLREMKKVLEKREIKPLRSLISRLKAEIAVLRSLSKPELERECVALRDQVKVLLNETDNLMGEIEKLKEALDSEKNAKDVLEKEVMNLQSNMAECASAGNAVLEREVSAREALITDLKNELVGVKNHLEKTMNESETLKNQLEKSVKDSEVLKDHLEKSVNESEVLKSKNEKLLDCVKSLECEQKELKNQINLFRSIEEELKKTITEEEEKQKELRKAIKAQEEKERELSRAIKELEEKEMEFAKAIKHHEDRETDYLKRIDEISVEMNAYKNELTVSKGIIEVLKGKVNEFEVLIKVKEETLRSREEELESAKNVSMDTKNELNRLKSEMDVLKSRLEAKIPEVVETNAGDEDLQNYEKDLEEKYAVEEALRKIENELDCLKSKLEECKTMEEEMSTLKFKKDSLLGKMAGFENEIESLKKKLLDFESLKNELDELKSQKNKVESEVDIANLYQQLLEQKNLITNLQKENESLKDDISKNESLLEIYKNLQKSSTETQMTPTAEFFTPPPMFSPRLSDPPDSTPETIELEVHKKEIAELENSYEQKIQNIQKTNAEKLKKLNENCEKETKCRTKIYYESINAIKYGYENDIKKLVEKHKISIMRLQGLHEDEVQELNTSYETQMEAMQTQNENLINDLKTETAEKCKQLREQHNQEIKELTAKFEELLKEKEAQYLEEKSKVEAALNENATGMKEVHQQQVEDLTQFYQNSITELEEKHSQELKKLKKSNLKRIDLIKNKYEALLVEERKKYEEQLEEMLIQLRNGGQEKDRSDKIQKKTPPPTSPSLNFHEVLQKILNEGLECLTIEELILVHSKTCFIPQIIGEDETGDREFSPRIGEGCRHRVLMTAEKEELLKRIFTLEHEIVIKQLETHEAIVNMEAAEMCRIQELKNALCSAQQKNAELKQLLSNQTKYEMDLKIDRHMLDRQAALHETNVMQKVKELERMKADKRRLEEELQMEKVNIKNLTAAMEAEKERHQMQRKRDAEYVESMRQRLEEALNHEQMMETQLDYEVKLRSRLEAELQHLESSLSYIPELHSSLQIDIKPSKKKSNPEESEVTKEGKVKRSKSRHRSKLKALNN